MQFVTHRKYFPSRLYKTSNSVDEKKKSVCTENHTMHINTEHTCVNIHVVRARKTKGLYFSKTRIPDTYIQGIQRRRENVEHSTFLARKRRKYSKMNCQYFRTRTLTFHDKYFQNVWGLLGDHVKVLCYKSEGRWFDPSWCQWIFHWHKILPIPLWPWGRLSL